ncbi:aminoglycoside phosphotransferase family protein [Actinoplanes sp. N902-109]|uniref:aminoglycoside phosphotransferase family protein n=1 Tax=Actinoplanes sp. (strain N902-109) TaxID=649831 RepID=UPI0003293F5D|nr:aminoglycoside phosphotransferase family protein [Actinoplanes sp. N902-109]AGL15358.1 aminoglycoside phosphotransferase [Actinoplanes sp. N902-109]
MLPAIDTPLVRDLVDAQFPQWSALPLHRVEPGGSDHVIHRLGDALSVRLPRHDGAIDQAAKEMTWLPRLAPHLPLAIPAPVAVGEPGFGYPWRWAVSRWLPGSVATIAIDSAATAEVLAGFLTALQGVPAGEVVELESAALGARDDKVRADITAVAGRFDAAAMTRLWHEAIDAPAWHRPPVLFHGDFHTGNLLAVDGRVSAVIDFGGLGLGDPAPDLMMAFTLMSAPTRAVFRRTLDVDAATWSRGRGWALAAGLNAFTSYAATSPRIAAATTRQILAALEG